MKSARGDFSQFANPSMALALGFCAAGAAVLVAGPMKGLVAMIGLLVVALCFMQPMACFFFVALTNTSFQVLGSAHIVGTPTSLSKIFGMVAVGSLLLHMMFAGWKLTASPLYRAIFAFFLVVLLWDFAVHHNGTEPFEGTNRYLLIVLITAITSTIAGQTQRSLDTAIILFSIAMSVTGIIGILEHFLPSLAVQSDDARTGLGTIGGIVDRESLEGVEIKRITGGIGDANWLSYSVAMSLPLLIYLWHRWPGFWPRAALCAMGALQAIALVFSYTRTGMLGFAIGAAFLLVRGVVPLRMLLSGLAVVLLAASIYLPPGFADRMFSSKYLKEGSTPLRTFFVTNATDIWLQSPIVGHGYKGFGELFRDSVYRRLPNDVRMEAWAVDLEESIRSGRENVADIGAHNLQLELLVEYGLVGFVLYFSIFILAFRELIRIEATGPPHLRILAIAIEAALIAFLFCGLLGHAKYLKVLWFLFGFVMAARRISFAGDASAKTLLEAGPAR